MPFDNTKSFQAPPGAVSYPGNSGIPVSPYLQAPPGLVPQAQKPFSTKAIISIVLGGISVLFWPLAIVTGPVGIIFGISGMRESKPPHGGKSGWGLALAATLVNVLMAVVFLALVAVVAGSISLFNELEKKQSAGGYHYDDDYETAGHHEEPELGEVQQPVVNDLLLIKQRLLHYYAHNLDSFEPGGPVVVHDPEAEIYFGDTPRVDATLMLEHLVAEGELGVPLAHYRLVVWGKYSAAVYRNHSTIWLSIQGDHTWHIYDDEDVLRRSPWKR